MKALTFNTGLFRTHDRDRVPAVQDRLARWVEFLAGPGREYDVLFLQEVYEREHSRCLQEALGRSYQTVWPEQGCPRPGGLWLGVRDPGPDWNPQFVPFDDSARYGEEKFLRNGVLQFRYGNIPFFGTHLQALRVNARGEPQVTGELEAFERQVCQLETLVGHGPHPRVVLGDLNVGPVLGAKVFWNLQKRLGLEWNRAGRTWDPNNPYIAQGEFSSDPGDQIDHFLTSSGLDVSCAVVLGNLSDHYGVSMERNA